MLTPAQITAQLATLAAVRAIFNEVIVPRINAAGEDLQARHAANAAPELLPAIAAFNKVAMAMNLVGEPFRKAVADTQSRLIVAPPPPPPPTQAIIVDGRYRTDQAQLFVAPPLGVTKSTGGSFYEVPARASVASPKSGLGMAGVGPTHVYVDVTSGWAWENKGGDWVDSAGVSQGPSPHWESTNSPSLDITAALKALTKWNAFIVRGAGTFQSNYSATPPSQSVVYTDGTTQELRCTSAIAFEPSSAYAQGGAPTISVGNGKNAAIEFERPTKAVASATLNLTYTGTITGFLANPPLNAEPVTSGLATAYPLDAGIKTNPSVIFSHLYEDGKPASEFLGPDGINVYNNNRWSPHVFDAAAPKDTSRLPFIHQGKWIKNIGNASLVDSSYKGEGFKPLAPGMGAIRVKTPGTTLADGAAAGYVGGYGCDLAMFLPDDLCGTLDEVFVRYYMFLGEHAPDYLSGIKMIRTEIAAAAQYALHGGKFGIGPSHWTQYGGNNNVGGGNIGWTSRNAYGDYPADIGSGAMRPGVHSWDMIGYNGNMGSIGGLGSAMYPGYWYCIESRLKLNTVDLSATPFTADPTKNLNDAEIDIWIDGRKVLEMRNFSYRKLPLDYSSGPSTWDNVSKMGRTPLDKGLLVPIRNLGVTAITLNDYNGGVLPATSDRVKFYAGLVVSKTRIGMMQNAPVSLPPPVKPPEPPVKPPEPPPVVIPPPVTPPTSAPSWLPARNSVAILPEVNSFESINPGDSGIGGYSYSDPNPPPPKQPSIAFLMGLGWQKIINDYSGGEYNPWYQHTPGNLGCMVYNGGGHSATGWNGIAIFDFNSLKHFIVCPGSLSVYPVDALSSECADGQPGSAHTYDTLATLGPEAGYPKGALISIYRAGTFVEGQQWNGASVHLFDFNNQGKKWQRLYSHGESKWANVYMTGIASAYDPDKKRVWWIGQGNQVPWTCYFDLTDNQQKKIAITKPAAGGVPQSNPDSKTCRYIASRKLVLMSDTVSYNDPTRRLFYFQTDAPELGWLRATTTQPMPPGMAFAFDWVPPLGKVVCYSGKSIANTFHLTIPAVLTDPWPVEAVPLASGQFEDHYVVGKRFGWSDAMGGAVFKGTAKNPVRVWRP